jgi:predicted transcriptional regulator
VVDRASFRQAILSALADAEMAKILQCATTSCKSVNEIIRQTSISHSTAYRKIKWMMDRGLLFTEKMDITPVGKKFSLVRSTVKSIGVTYDQGNISVCIEYNINTLEKTAERLFNLGLD